MNDLIALIKKQAPLYFIEAWGLGTFMLSACFFTILFEYPAWGMSYWIPSAMIRRVFIGFAMGFTAVCIIYSPWGSKSGAQLNPSVTLTTYFLKKISGIDAVFYMLFQTVGGTAGVWLLKYLLPMQMAHPAVIYVVTIPGKDGIADAFWFECIISFTLMFMTLITSNSPSMKLRHFTGIFSGILILLFITFEAPYSGMSMNPARTVASALPSGIWVGCWIYFVGPPLSMLLAASIYNFLFHEGKLYSIRHFLTPRNEHHLD